MPSSTTNPALASGDSPGSVRPAPWWQLWRGRRKFVWLALLLAGAWLSNPGPAAHRAALHQHPAYQEYQRASAGAESGRRGVVSWTDAFVCGWTQKLAPAAVHGQLFSVGAFGMVLVLD